MKTPHPHCSFRSGFALILVMVVIFALSVLVAAFAYSMSVEMRLAQITDYDAEMEWMGRSGIELARFALVNKCPEQRDIDSLNQFWAGGNAPCSNNNPQLEAYEHGDGYAFKNFPLGNGKISVKIIDMERKFDINLLADPRMPQLEILQKAVMECGVTDPSQSSKIVDSILDWRSPGPSSHLNGAKNDYYNQMSPPYNCKQGPMEDISELLLIQGVTPDIYWGPNSTNHPPAAYQQKAFDHTPHSTKSRFQNEASDVPNPVGMVELFSPFGNKLNINTASAKTLQLLPGINADTAQRIVEQRAGPDGIDGTEDDAPFHSVMELNSGLPGGGFQPGVPPGGIRPGVGPGGLPAPGAMAGGIPGAPQAGVAAGGLAAYCDVRSYVFEVHVEAEINGFKRNFIGVISRGGQNSAQLNCVRFHCEE
ncbi:MAG TPA: helix-hairpin-helix domain-containing protein [Candidatus Acidoferrum sp.]|nr:helix-hairpin-helix domain-containing protein [Candidatus Acidoferrum sp.]